jgi:negative regulator of flagellin synthesis FlgM
MADMTIKGVGSIDTIQPNRKTGGVKRADKAAATDTISISREAKAKSEAAKVRDMVAALPDVRADKVEELRRKVNDPAYLNARVIDATADKIMDAWWA